VIVISGALVLVALVLLIFGITTTDLDFVYASIVVSLVSFVFLLIGILQRRGDKGAEAPAAPSREPAEQERATADRGDVDEGVTAVVPRVREATPSAAAGSVRVDQPAEEPAPEGDELEDTQVAGTVLVVAGRPRYHVPGCRYLTGKSPNEVDVADARDEGFTPCGVCKPDDVLATVPAAEPELTVEPEPEPEPDPEPEPEPEPDRDREPVAAARARRSRSTSSSRTAPAKRSPRPRKQPSAAARAASANPAEDPVLESVAADEAPAASGDGAAKAPASRRRTSNVVVIPDRGKFHRAECRYVRNADETSTMSRTAAARQGYDACGVCKP
jgi:outer membrane biosynthesis protein TonB